MSRWTRCLPGAGLVLGLLLACPSAQAAEATLFLTYSTPTDIWGLGVGGDLSFSFLKLWMFGVEGAHQRSSNFDAPMNYLTVQALLVLPVKKLRLYGGLGAGLFYESASSASESDFGSLTALILGAKVRIQDILVLKIEYRRYGLTGEPPLPLQQRFSIAAGLTF